MFNQFIKMTKNVKVHFKVVDGKIMVKNLKVSPEDYIKVAQTITGLVDKGVLQNRNFNATINIEL